METLSEAGADLTGAAGRIGQRLFVIAENRLQLLMVEAQEERERVLQAIWLALGAAAFGLLAGVTLTLVVAVALWGWGHPIVALLVLTAIYVIAAGVFYNRLAHLQRNWQTLTATLEQLKKDRECLEKNLL
jgi:uncharacterized membrane protein YqjE